MSWNGIYAFDELDAELSLLPMAARRALDTAGRHLSLSVWQTLPLERRRQLIAHGAGAQVDGHAVSQLLRDAGASTREQDVIADPPSDNPPVDVRTALASEHAQLLERWSRLRPLDRFVLAQLARRNKLDRLREAAAEIAAADGG